MPFNLSKNNDPVPEKKSNAWVGVILAASVVGVGVWYFIPKRETAAAEVAMSAPAPSSATPDTTTAVVPSAAAAKAASDTVAVSTAVNTTNTAPGAAAPPRIAASFNKGTAAPIAISDEIVNEIKQGHKITIYGYASSEGDLSVNLKLAAERAASFKQYLISRGIDEGMITAVGKGIDNPIASNNTEPGRAKNRRVEVHIE
ncbi:OmpA family protein [Chitinophaga filiformis]|uniref:OmpA family protein n=1 Tax=Chitinophaga filiformis TaxID=104663 RepID=A0A1G7Z349_CHIFI|nr:OmpA family protein [Chitinophaga filiformis]SDH03133.1 OmpA family protein [Chitinophaga filiformis]